MTQGGFAISRKLLLQGEEFAPEESLAHRFFTNLLPEGGAWDQVVCDLKIATGATSRSIHLPHCLH